MFLGMCTLLSALSHILVTVPLTVDACVAAAASGIFLFSTAITVRPALLHPFP